MYIHVKVSTGAKEDSIIKIRELHFIVHVRQKAERNQANKRVIELIAKYHLFSPKSVRIISGHHSTSKLFSIPD